MDRFKGPQGELSLDTPAIGIVLIRIVGFGHSHFAGPCVDLVERSAREQPGSAYFIDLDRMDSYDSILRRRMIEVFATHRKATGEIHAFALSPITKMGLHAASLVLSNLITHRRRIDFDRALEDAIRSAGSPVIARAEA